jgi:hypothetical protein
MLECIDDSPLGLSIYSSVSPTSDTSIGPFFCTAELTSKPAPAAGSQTQWMPSAPTQPETSANLGPSLSPPWCAVRDQALQEIPL